MPPGYVIVDARTVRGPDGRSHDVEDAIAALPWTPQLCPLMRHEYAILHTSPEWAWYVVSAMVTAKNPDTFRAFFRGAYQANYYWDAPDGLRYWRGNRSEIDRGQPDGAGLRRVAEGAKAIRSWEGPTYVPNGIGLYEQDTRERWWPTEAALASGYQPCAFCQRTDLRSTIVATPNDAHRVPALIAVAQQESLRRLGRGLTLEELEGVVRRIPDQDHPGPLTRLSDRPPSETVVVPGLSDEIKGVIERLLDLREAEAPLGDRGYRGPFSQKVIAQIADVPVKTVSAMAIERDRRRSRG